MLVLGGTRKCLHVYLVFGFGINLANAILAMDLDMSPNFIQALEARQSNSSLSDSSGNSGGGSSPVKTTLIFAATLGSLLGIFILFSLYSYFRQRFGWKMPHIPMPDPPSYLSVFRTTRRNPEDGPPLPLYMEQPNNSTTVLQRSESRRTHRSSHSSLSNDSPIGMENITTDLHRPPPYMKDPLPERDSPLSSPVSLGLPLSPVSPIDRNGRDLNRSQTN